MTTPFEKFLEERRSILLTILHDTASMAGHEETEAIEGLVKETALAAFLMAIEMAREWVTGEDAMKLMEEEPESNGYDSALADVERHLNTLAASVNQSL